MTTINDIQNVQVPRAAWTNEGESVNIRVRFLWSYRPTIMPGNVRKTINLNTICPETAEQINTQVTPHIWYTDIRKIGAAKHRFLLAQASAQ